MYQLIAEPSKFMVTQTLGLRQYGSSEGFLDYSQTCRALRPWQNYTDERQEYCFKSVKTHVCTIKKRCAFHNEHARAHYQIRCDGVNFYVVTK